MLEALPTDGFSVSTFLLNLNANTARGVMGFCFCIYMGLEHWVNLDWGPNKKLRGSLFVFYCLKLFFEVFYFQNLCKKIKCLYKL